MPTTNCNGAGSRGLVRLLRYHMWVFLQHSEDDPDPPQWAPAPLAMITDNRGQVAGCAHLSRPVHRQFGRDQDPQTDPRAGSRTCYLFLVRQTASRSHLRRRSQERPLDRESSVGVCARPLSDRQSTSPLPRPAEVELTRRRIRDHHRPPHGQLAVGDLMRCSGP